MALKWQDKPPTCGGHYWFVGVPYYLPCMVKINEGVRSCKDDTGKRTFYPEMNGQFPEVNDCLWQSDGWPVGQWAGPIELPPDPHRPVIHPLDARKARMQP